jgi:hypothetical protein
MVRRAAAQSLGPLAEVADAHTLSSTVAPIFLKLTQDGTCNKPVLQSTFRPPVRTS